MGALLLTPKDQIDATTAEVRRIVLLRGWVNNGERKSRSCYAPLLLSCWYATYLTLTDWLAGSSTAPRVPTLLTCPHCASDILSTFRPIQPRPTVSSAQPTTWKMPPIPPPRRTSCPRAIRAGAQGVAISALQRAPASKRCPITSPSKYPTSTAMYTKLSVA